MRRLVVLLAFFCFASTHAESDPVKLIREGRVDEARRRIAELSSASRRDGAVLFAQALLEKDGRAARQLMETAVRSDLPAGLLEEERYQVILYLLAENDFRGLADSCAAYLRRWEGGKYREAVLRLNALALSRAGQVEKGRRLRELLLKEGRDNDWGLLGRIDGAAELVGQGKYDEAGRMLRKAGAGKSGAAAALYLSSVLYLEKGNIDEALLQYNLLREKYPRAVGLADLEDMLSRVEKSIDDEDEAEKITGTIYSVQVGVFSVRANAASIAERMKKHGEPVEVKEKTISGKKYFVVYVGQMRSSKKALFLKSKLETAEKESYQVVAR